MSSYDKLHRFARFNLCYMILALSTGASAENRPSSGPRKPFEIRVIDDANGWPVPLVELRTTNQVRFITDNDGIIAFDLPELMGRATWLTVSADGYEKAPDAFGSRGIRIKPEPGGEIVIKVKRSSIAKRVGRITGTGLFAESQKLGRERGWPESGVMGSDTIQAAVHNEKFFWTWGDTAIPSYPLGIYHISGARTAVQPVEKFEPPLRLKLDYFTDKSGRPRAIAKMPGPGPTWISGLVSLPDRSGVSRLVAMYSKITPPLDAYEQGLCVWNDDTQNFEHLKTFWKKSEDVPKAPPMPRGHAVIVKGEDGKNVVLFGDPLPTLRCEATFEAWKDPSAWQKLTPQKNLVSAEAGSDVTPNTGSIAWNAFRRRWVTVFMQTFGKPSAFGELWYAEADAPEGPWGPAVKVLSHRNYTFYNPRLQIEMTPEKSPILLFEGTYTREFSSNPEATPRYDYNQILYRLDLDDPQLAAAQKSESPKARQ